MNTTERKLVFAPWGSDTYGDDILLFEHGLIFGLEMAVETTGGMSFADVHDVLGGADKRERPVPAMHEADVRMLAAKAKCDVFVDGMLQSKRDPETGGLTEVIVALRLFFPKEDKFEAPDALLFHSFVPGGTPSKLTPDYDIFIALQYQLSEALLAAMSIEPPISFTTDTLQVTPRWDAYELLLKGKRLTQIAENKLGYYEQALQRDPQFFLALYNSAMLYKTQTDYHSERNRLMRAASTTTDPRLLGDVYFELGLSSIYLGDTKTARNFWEKALEYGGDNPSLYVNMAGTYEQEEKWAEARQLNEMALEKFPDFHKAIVNLARLHAMMGQLDQAIPLYERALELQPGDALRHSVLGGCYLADDRIEDARAQFELAVEIDPESDPGKYAQQELDKMGPAKGENGDDEGKKKKRWGLW
ncbi:MAG: tetratricopeptide repeat protein [Capsulimonas sp.]|uniref:tetratricopeptide repeat protein n=1 Tax=Capsulimonas sp. TaxID=2494211 RepID=UPI003264AEE5